MIRLAIPSRRGNLCTMGPGVNMSPSAQGRELSFCRVSLLRQGPRVVPGRWSAKTSLPMR